MRNTLKCVMHAEVRHEYFAGCVVTMDGIFRRQNTIAGNLFAAIHGKLQGGPCRPFMGDLKLGIQRSNETLFYYPDIVVECGSTAAEDDSYTTEPKVIIDVLSPTTERIDRREKFWAYTETASLEDYVLVDQQESAVTVFRKTTDWYRPKCGG
jgi:Uma2 family endonuclease